MKYLVYILVSAVFFLNLFSASVYADEQNKDTCIKYSQHFWSSSFLTYFEKNDMDKKVKNLKKGMDDISKQYIDKYMANSKYWDKCINECKDYDENKLWSDYDIALFDEFSKKSDGNGFIFWYSNKYGMRDLPQEVMKKIDGKDIIEGGAWPGNITEFFSELFPNSQIYAYEAMPSFMKDIENWISNMEKAGKNTKNIHIINKALGSEKGEKELFFNATRENCQVVKLDEDFYLQGGKNLGLIKLDIEGDETPTIEGAKKLIKKYKPVLVIAIYHTPQDFFELKDKIKKINPKYKFMIRRSENAITDADLMLIAY